MKAGTPSRAMPAFVAESMPAFSASVAPATSASARASSVAAPSQYPAEAKALPRAQVPYWHQATRSELLQPARDSAAARRSRQLQQACRPRTVQRLAASATSQRAAPLAGSEAAAAARAIASHAIENHSPGPAGSSARRRGP